MPKTTWIFASFFSVLAVLGLVGLQLHRRNLELRDVREEAAESRRFAETAARTNAAFAAEIAANRSQIEALEEKFRLAVDAQSGLEKQMRAELESKDVTISELQGKLTVNILDRVLFDSGEAKLKPDGEEVLRKVANILAQFPNRQVQVIGHTDNVPIRGMTKGGFVDNWELSAGRAVAAVRFLQAKAGVDPHRIAAVGYGEFHPLADNATAEGRAKNRRIAVVVMPEEIAPNDLPRASRTQASASSSRTNAVAAPATNAAPAIAPDPAASPVPDPPPIPPPSPAGELKPPTGE